MPLVGVTVPWCHLVSMVRCLHQVKLSARYCGHLYSLLWREWTCWHQRGQVFTVLREGSLMHWWVGKKWRARYCGHLYSLLWCKWTCSHQQGWFFTLWRRGLKGIWMVTFGFWGWASRVASRFLCSCEERGLNGIWMVADGELVGLLLGSFVHVGKRVERDLNGRWWWASRVASRFLSSRGEGSWTVPFGFWRWASRVASRVFCSRG